VARARYEPNQLRERDREVEELRNKEQHQGFAKVPGYANHSECQSGEVRVRVPHKHSGREPVVIQQSAGGGDKR